MYQFSPIKPGCQHNAHLPDSAEVHFPINFNVDTGNCTDSPPQLCSSCRSVLFSCCFHFWHCLYWNPGPAHTRWASSQSLSCPANPFLVFYETIEKYFNLTNLGEIIKARLIRHKEFQITYIYTIYLNSHNSKLLSFLLWKKNLELLCGGLKELFNNISENPSDAGYYII